MNKYLSTADYSGFAESVELHFDQNTCAPETICTDKRWYSHNGYVDKRGE